MADNHDELVAAAKELLVNDAYRESMGHKAAVRSREFSWNACADGVYTVLEASIAGQLVSGLVGPIASPSEPSQRESA